MLEIPEAAVLAYQINHSLSGKTIRAVVTAQSPHKFAWFSAEPAYYAKALPGKTLGQAVTRGGMIEIQVEDQALLFCDGVNLRYHTDPEERPAKHQLLIEFSDGSALSACVAMYGGLYCFPLGNFDNPYYKLAKEKPSPLGNDFTRQYFSALFLPELEKLSLKAFLATEQRIPGLGNGVLQDILYNARLYPKRKVNTLSAAERDGLFDAIITTLHEMAASGGRDTERDLFGQEGGYATRVSKNTVGLPCPECGSLIKKEAYMGGSIYYCPGCQEG